MSRSGMSTSFPGVGHNHNTGGANLNSARTSILCFKCLNSRTSRNLQSYLKDKESYLTFNELLFLYST